MNTPDIVPTGRPLTARIHRQPAEGWRIAPLSAVHREPVLAILRAAFPEEFPTAVIDIDVSLRAHKPDTLLDTHTGMHVVPSTYRFWICLDATDEVVSVVGLYETEEDSQEAYWGGWFATDPERMREGAGSALSAFIARKALSAQKRYFRLWTIPPPDAGGESALRLYRSFGMERVATRPSIDPTYTHPIWFFEADLLTTRHTMGMWDETAIRPDSSA